MNIFKHQHPSNLISRLFMLEYMRELSAPVLYAKANKHQREKMFYRFFMEDSEEDQIDINYEYCTFIATLHELEILLSKFLEEIDVIEDKRDKIYKAVIEEKQEEERITPTDINIMDLAQTEINKNNKNGLIL